MTFVFSVRPKMKTITSLILLTVICLGSITSAEQLNVQTIPVESLEPVVIDKERLSALKYAPVVELEE